MAILSLLHRNTSCLQYFSEVDRFVRWCDENYLILNETRTVEMFFDPRSVEDHSPVIINGKSIEQVTSHKYLGVYMDNLLCCLLCCMSTVFVLDCSRGFIFCEG